MSLPMEIISNLHYPRRLLLLNTPFFHSPQTATPSPTQSPTDANANTSGSGSNTNSFDANVVMILSVLICAIICSLFVNSLIKCVIRCTSLVNGEPNYYLNMVNHKKKLSSGVDKRALRTFPVVKYCSDKIIQGLGTECVICLSEFKEGEKVRILPKCNHGFHVKCIDKWLGSHSSCPTCRQSLIDTCHKIIGSDNNTTDHQAPAAAAAADSVVTISIVPLERENMVRNNQL